jgi:hypothetical protein
MWFMTAVAIPVINEDGGHIANKNATPFEVAPTNHFRL